jgi:hypothetical protein
MQSSQYLNHGCIENLSGNDEEKCQNVGRDLRTGGSLSGSPEVLGSLILVIIIHHVQKVLFLEKPHFAFASLENEGA